MLNLLFSLCVWVLRIDLLQDVVRERKRQKESDGPPRGEGGRLPGDRVLFVCAQSMHRQTHAFSHGRQARQRRRCKRRARADAHNQKKKRDEKKGDTSAESK